MAARSGNAHPLRKANEIAAGDYARYDVYRVRRTGTPEVILAEGKTLEHLRGLLRALARRGHGALVSRPTPPQLRALRADAENGLALTFLAHDRVVRLAGPLGVRPLRGTVALITAGTADVPVADEAEAVLNAAGVRTVRRHDVGVAGIHRLERGLGRLERAHPSAYLVFAGREGALPTVVAGLVHAPVIGVPTSIGYGRGGKGEAALLAMLQSCAPVAVVNIDAAVPAALFAIQLLSTRSRVRPRPAGRRRRGPPESREEGF